MWDLFKHLRTSVSEKRMVKVALREEEELVTDPNLEPEPTPEPEPKPEVDVFAKLDSGEVIPLDKTQQPTIDKIAATQNYALWQVPGKEEVTYAGTVDAWANQFLGESKLTEAKFTEDDIRDATEMLLTTSQSSAVAKNMKTGVSVDFSTNCRFRKEGQPCPYCYVEIGRKKADSFVRKLFQSGWTKETLEQAISTKKYPQKATIGSGYRRKGTAFRKPAPMKAIYDNAPYNGEFLEFDSEDIKSANDQGGVRLYANSDYGSSEKGTEWEDEQLSRLFADAKKMGLQIKAITKNPEFIKKWSDQTSVTDLSLDDLKKYGVPSNAMSYNDALSLIRRHPHAKLRVVAFNPEEAIKYAQDPNISTITLFHGSPSMLPKEMTSKVNVVDMKHGSKANEEVHKAVGEKIWRQKFCATGETGTCATCQNKCGIQDVLARLKATKPIVKEK